MAEPNVLVEDLWRDTLLYGGHRTPMVRGQQRWWSRHAGTRTAPRAASNSIISVHHRYAVFITTCYDFYVAFHYAIFSITSRYSVYNPWNLCTRGCWMVPWFRVSAVISFVVDGSIWSSFARSIGKLPLSRWQNNCGIRALGPVTLFQIQISTTRIFQSRNSRSINFGSSFSIT